jgi:hypothetical protein
MTLTSWARLPGVDPTKANIARVYDYWLRGTHNLVADRELARRMESLDPLVPAAARGNRAFLGRVVRFLVTECGIRQFMDLGSGIPTVGNVHEIAQHAAPSTRVVYVDRDATVVALGRELLAGNDMATVIHADLRHPEDVLGNPQTRKLIDFTAPVAILFVATLHFVLDSEDPHRIINDYRDAAAPGSYMVISHVSNEDNPRLAASIERLYTGRAANGQARSREEILSLFGGWELAEPGLVYAPCWRPTSPGDVPAHPERMWFLAGVASKKGGGDAAPER